MRNIPENCQKYLVIYFIRENLTIFACFRVCKLIVNWFPLFSIRGYFLFQALRMSLSAGAVRFAEIFSLSSLVSQAWLRRGSSNINDGNVIHNDRLQLISLRQARDVDENCNRLFLQSFDCFLPLSSNDGASSSGPIEDLRERSTLEVSKGQITDISPSGLHTLIISSSNDKVYISLTSKSMPYFKREISSIHGKVMGDSGLGGSSWSFDENFFIYVAMEKTIEAKSSFEVPSGDKFGYQEDWGEKYDGVSKLVLCVLNIETGEITLVPNIDSNELTVGQPVFHPTESYRIVYTAWKNSPRKLGLIYCYQRPANLLSADLTALLSSSSSSSPSSSSSTSPSSSPSSSVSPPPPPSSSPPSSPPSVEHVNLTPTVYTARSPRWTPNGDAVVFIGSMDRIATHNSCFQLLHLPMTSSSSPGVNVIVDKVINPGAFPDDFPGLFCDQLPRYCFLSQDELCLTTQWRSAEAVVQVSLRSGSVSRLEKLLDILTSSGLPSSSSSSLSIASCSVLDVSTDGDIVFTASSPSTPQKLGVLNVHSQRLQCAQSPVIPVTSKVLPLLFSRNPRQYLSSLKWSVSSDSPQTESVLLTPVPEADFHSPLPLIVAIHGGPHAASPTTFLPSYAFLSSFLHASVLHVNYRGSTGFGQASIDSLPGNIGYAFVNGP